MRLKLVMSILLFGLTFLCFCAHPSFQPLLAQDIPFEAIEFKEEGDRAIRRGEINQALYFYQKALSLAPHFPEAIYSLGFTYDMDLDDLPNALYYYSLYLEVAPRGSYSEEVMRRLQDAEKKLKERKNASGLTERGRPTDSTTVSRRGVKSPPNQTEALPASSSPAQDEIPESLTVTPASAQVITTSRTGDINIFKLQEKILKYDLKLGVWKREGFIDQFNKLALLRGSTLEIDIAGQREALRIERKKVTDFINYQDEGIKRLFKKAVLQGMATLGIDLSHLPVGLTAETYIHSYRILDVPKEDARFIDLALEVSVDMAALKRELINRSYIFEPHRITLILQGIPINLIEVFIDTIIKKSDYLGLTSGSLYPLYTSLEVFNSELRRMEIGKYRLSPVSTGSNSITVQVIAIEDKG